MKSFLITGATGFIGMELAKALAGTGQTVHLLVRSPEKAEPLLRKNVRLFQGDITDFGSLDKAMEGTTHVYHLAALAKAVSKDPSDFDRINVEGTRNVLECAVRNHIKKVVYTSTAGVFGTTGPGNDATENSIKPEKYLTEYERTKRISEDICREYLKRGLNITLSYPTRVFGPGVINDSNAVTKIISLYIRGKWRFIPGNGKTFGNYVYIKDVVNGLILAMEKGANGEGYLMGGHNVTFNELFSTMQECSEKKYGCLHIPYPVLWLAGLSIQIYGYLTRNQPLITPVWIRRYLMHRRVSSRKAINELGYSITPLSEAISETINWLKYRAHE